MDKLLYLIAPFGCVIGMVACMAMMGRGRKHTTADAEPAASASEVAELRAEVARLRAEQSTRADG